MSKNKKLHVVISLLSGKAALAVKTNKALADMANAGHRFVGQIKHFLPKKADDKGEALRELIESKSPETTMPHEISEYIAIMGDVLDLEIMREIGNSTPAAYQPIVINGVSYSLPPNAITSLIKRLTEFRQAIEKMATREGNRVWLRADDSREGVYVTEKPEVSEKTERTIVPIELSPATDKHPAQVKELQKDVVVGHYEKLILSSAPTVIQKSQLLANIDQWITTLTVARQSANEVEVEDIKLGAALFNDIVKPIM